jgi:hypothetical protein
MLFGIEQYSFDQSGCRMLQQMIQTNNNTAAQNELSPDESIFLKCLVHFMLPIIADVMDNQFGNYLCQKIIEVAGSSTLQVIVN